MVVITVSGSEQKSWLITGGCGFLGVNLIEKLKKTLPEVSIRVFDNLSVGKKEDLLEVCDFHEVDFSGEMGRPNGVELVIGDICDGDLVLKACKDVDVIIHLAGNTGVDQSVKKPVLDCKTNVLGTLNLLEAARLNGVQKFVFASSGAPLGEQEPPIHEEKVPRPVSPYGASKLACEGYCSAYYRTFGIKTVALRFGNVYGPHSKYKSSVVAKFIKQAMAGEPLEIYGDGEQTRDFIYVEDIVQAILVAAGSDTGGEVFQIATYRETTVNELTEMLLNIFNTAFPEHKLQVSYKQARLGDVKRNYSDISKARKRLGFNPDYDLERGLMETLNWFIKNQKSK